MKLSKRQVEFIEDLKSGVLMYKYISHSDLNDHTIATFNALLNHGLVRFGKYKQGIGWKILLTKKGKAI